VSPLVGSFGHDHSRSRTSATWSAVGSAETVTPNAWRGHHGPVDIYDPDHEPIDYLNIWGVVDPGPTLAELFEMIDPPPTTVSLDLGDLWF
jgi:hypothetical protein